MTTVTGHSLLVGAVSTASWVGGCELWPEIHSDFEGQHIIYQAHSTSFLEMGREAEIRAGGGKQTKPE